MERNKSFVVSSSDESDIEFCEVVNDKQNPNDAANDYCSDSEIEFFNVSNTKQEKSSTITQNDTIPCINLRDVTLIPISKSTQADSSQKTTERTPTIENVDLTDKNYDICDQNRIIVLSPTRSPNQLYDQNDTAVVYDGTLFDSSPVDSPNELSVNNQKQDNITGLSENNIIDLSPVDSPAELSVNNKKQDNITGLSENNIIDLSPVDSPSEIVELSEDDDVEVCCETTIYNANNHDELCVNSTAKSSIVCENFRRFRGFSKRDLKGSKTRSKTCSNNIRELENIKTNLYTVLGNNKNSDKSLLCDSRNSEETFHDMEYADYSDLLVVKKFVIVKADKVPTPKKRKRKFKKNIGKSKKIRLTDDDDSNTGLKDTVSKSKRTAMKPALNRNLDKDYTTKSCMNSTEKTEYQLRRGRSKNQQTNSIDSEVNYCDQTTSAESELPKEVATGVSSEQNLGNDLNCGETSFDNAENVNCPQTASVEKTIEPVYITPKKRVRARRKVMKDDSKTYLEEDFNHSVSDLLHQEMAHSLQIQQLKELENTESQCVPARPKANTNLDLEMLEEANVDTSISFDDNGNTSEETNNEKNVTFAQDECDIFDKGADTVHNSCDNVFNLSENNENREIEESNSNIDVEVKINEHHVPIETEPSKDKLTEIDSNECENHDTLENVRIIDHSTSDNTHSSLDIIKNNEECEIEKPLHKKKQRRKHKKRKCLINEQLGESPSNRDLTKLNYTDCYNILTSNIITDVRDLKLDKHKPLLLLNQHNINFDLEDGDKFNVLFILEENEIIKSNTYKNVKILNLVMQNKILIVDNATLIAHFTRDFNKSRNQIQAQQTLLNTFIHSLQLSRKSENACKHVEELQNRKYTDNSSKRLRSKTITLGNGTKINQLKTKTVKENEAINETTVKNDSTFVEVNLNEDENKSNKNSSGKIIDEIANFNNDNPELPDDGSDTTEKTCNDDSEKAQNLASDVNKVTNSINKNIDHQNNTIKITNTNEIDVNLHNFSQEENFEVVSNVAKFHNCLQKESVSENNIMQKNYCN